MQNEDDYAEKLEELSQSWSKPFLEYYQSKLHQDIIKHSAKWVLEEHKVYDPYSGVTNNMSESMNAVIKRMMHCCFGFQLSSDVLCVRNNERT